MLSPRKIFLYQKKSPQRDIELMTLHQAGHGHDPYTFTYTFTSRYMMLLLMLLHDAREICQIKPCNCVFLSSSSSLWW